MSNYQNKKPTSTIRVYPRAWEHLTDNEQKVFVNEDIYEDFTTLNFQKNKQDGNWYLKDDRQLTDFGKYPPTITMAYDFNTNTADRVKPQGITQQQLLGAFTNPIDPVFVEEFDKWKTHLFRKDRSDNSVEVFPRQFKEMPQAVQTAFGDEDSYIQSLKQFLEVQTTGDGNTKIMLKDNRMLTTNQYTQPFIRQEEVNGRKQAVYAKIQNKDLMKTLLTPYDNEDQKVDFENQAMTAIGRQIQERVGSREWDDLTQEARQAFFFQNFNSGDFSEEDYWGMVSHALAQVSEDNFPSGMDDSSNYQNPSNIKNHKWCNTKGGKVKSSNPSVYVSNKYTVTFSSHSAEPESVNVLDYMLEEFGRAEYNKQHGYVDTNTDDSSAKILSSKQIKRLREDGVVEAEKRRIQEEKEFFFNRQSADAILATSIYAELLNLRKDKLSSETPENNQYDKDKGIDFPAVRLPSFSNYVSSLYRETTEETAVSAEKSIEKNFNAYNEHKLETEFGLNALNEWAERNHDKMVEIGIELNEHGLPTNGVKDFQRIISKAIQLSRRYDPQGSRTYEMDENGNYVLDEQKQKVPLQHMIVRDDEGNPNPDNKTKSHVSEGDLIIVSYQLYNPDPEDTSNPVALRHVSGQFIKPDGYKNSMVLASNTGFAVYGNPNPQIEDFEDANRIIIAEGYATAASIYENLSEEEKAETMVLSGFNANTIAKVVDQVQTYFPDKETIIAVDDDRYSYDEKSGFAPKPFNTGMKNFGKIQERYPNVKAIIPRLQDYANEPPAVITTAREIADSFAQDLNSHEGEQGNYYESTLHAADMLYDQIKELNRLAVSGSDFNDEDVYLKKLTSLHTYLEKQYPRDYKQDELSVDDVPSMAIDLSEDRMAADTARAIDYYQNMPSNQKRDAYDQSEPVSTADFVLAERNLNLKNLFNYSRKDTGYQAMPMALMPQIPTDASLEPLVDATLAAPVIATPAAPVAKDQVPNNTNIVTAEPFAFKDGLVDYTGTRTATPKPATAFGIVDIEIPITNGEKQVDPNIEQRGQPEKGDHFNNISMQVHGFIEGDNKELFAVGVTTRSNARYPAELRNGEYTGRAAQDVVIARVASYEETFIVTRNENKTAPESEVAEKTQAIYQSNVEHMQELFEANRHNPTGLIVNLQDPTTIDATKKVLTSQPINHLRNSSTNANTVNEYTVVARAVNALSDNSTLAEGLPTTIRTGSFSLEYGMNSVGTPVTVLNQALQLGSIKDPNFVQKATEHLNITKIGNREVTPFLEVVQPYYQYDKVSLDEKGNLLEDTLEIGEHPIRIYPQKVAKENVVYNENNEPTTQYYTEQKSIEDTYRDLWEFRDPATVRFAAMVSGGNVEHDTLYAKFKATNTDGRKNAYKDYKDADSARAFLLASGEAERLGFTTEGTYLEDANRKFLRTIEETGGSLNSENNTLITNLNSARRAVVESMQGSDFKAIIGEQFYASRDFRADLHSAANKGVEGGNKRLSHLVNSIEKVKNENNPKHGYANYYFQMSIATRDIMGYSGMTAANVTNFGGFTNNNAAVQTPITISSNTELPSMPDKIAQGILATTFTTTNDSSIINNPNLYNGNMVENRVRTILDPKAEFTPVNSTANYKTEMESIRNSNIARLVNAVEQEKPLEGKNTPDLVDPRASLLSLALQDKEFRDTYARPILEKVADSSYKKYNIYENAKFSAQATIGVLDILESENVTSINDDVFRYSLKDDSKVKLSLSQPSVDKMKERIFKQARLILGEMVEPNQANEIAPLKLKDADIQRISERNEYYTSKLESNPEETVTLALNDKNNQLLKNVSSVLKGNGFGSPKIKDSNTPASLVYVVFNQDDKEKMEDLIFSNEYAQAGLNASNSRVYMASEHSNTRQLVSDLHTRSGNGLNGAAIMLVNKAIDNPDDTALVSSISTENLFSQQLGVAKSARNVYGENILPSDNSIGGIKINFNQTPSAQMHQLVTGIANGEMERLKNNYKQSPYIHDSLFDMLNTRMGQGGVDTHSLVSLVKSTNEAFQPPLPPKMVMAAESSALAGNWGTYDAVHNTMLQSLMNAAKTPQFSRLIVNTAKVLNEDNQKELADSLHRLARVASTPMEKLLKDRERYNFNADMSDHDKEVADLIEMENSQNSAYENAKQNRLTNRLAYISLASLMTSEQAQRVAVKMQEPDNGSQHPLTDAERNRRQNLSDGLISVNNMFMGGVPTRPDLMISYDVSNNINPYSLDSREFIEPFSIESKLLSMHKAQQEQLTSSKKMDSRVLDYGVNAKILEGNMRPLPMSFDNASNEAALVAQPTINPTGDMLFNPHELEFLKGKLENNPNAEQEFVNATATDAPNPSELMAKVVNVALNESAFNTFFKKTVESRISIASSLEDKNRLYELKRSLNDMSHEPINDNDMPKDWQQVKDLAVDITVRMGYGDTRVISPTNVEQATVKHSDKYISEISQKFDSIEFEPHEARLSYAHLNKSALKEMASIKNNEVLTEYFDNQIKFNDKAPEFTKPLMEAMQTNIAFMSARNIIDFADKSETLRQDQKGLRAISKLSESAMATAVKSDNEKTPHQIARIILAGITPNSQDTEEVKEVKQQATALFSALLTFEGSPESIQLKKNLEKYNLNENTAGLRLTSEDISGERSTYHALNAMKRVFLSGNEVQNNATNQPEKVEDAVKAVLDFAKQYKNVSNEKVVKTFADAPKFKPFEYTFPTAAIVAINQQYDAIVLENGHKSDIVNENAKRYDPSAKERIYQQVDNRKEWDDNNRLLRSVGAVLRGGTANPESTALAIATMAKVDEKFAQTAKDFLSVQPQERVQPVLDILEKSRELKVEKLEINDAKLSKMYELAVSAIVSSAVKEDNNKHSNTIARNKELAQNFQEFATKTDNPTGFHAVSFAQAAEKLAKDLPISGANKSWMKEASENIESYISKQNQRTPELVNEKSNENDSKLNQRRTNSI